MRYSLSANIDSVFFMSKNTQNGLQKAIGASYSVLGSLLLFSLIGWWLDKKTSSDNFWLIIGLFIGVIVGLYQLAKILLKK
jgi:F0F1-type ATP synthase assembly protein I